MALNHALQKLHYGHDAIIDWLLANPHCSQGECAAAFGYTEPWLSRIVNSDMFRMEYERRLSEKRSCLDNELAVDMRRVARKSVAAVERRLDSGACSDAFLGNTMERSLAALGFVQDSKNANGNGNAPNTTINVLVTQETLERARERSLANNGTVPAKIINGEVSQQYLPGKEESPDGE